MGRRVPALLHHGRRHDGHTRPSDRSGLTTMAANERVTSGDSRTVLLVDDDETFGERMSRGLQARGFAGTHGATLAATRAISNADSPELAVVDLRLPDGHGLDAVTHLHAID